MKPAADACTRDNYTPEEMDRLFPADVREKNDFTPWRNELGYTAFLVAAFTGMRKGEVRALNGPPFTWRKDGSTWRFWAACRG